MAEDEPQDSAGPSSPPPPLPEGWLAQWEGVSRKWYYVQRATGKSQWDVPTEPVILTPSTTPGSIGTGPTQAPGSGLRPLSPQEAMEANSPNMDGTRGFFSNSATKPILSSLLGGSHGNSGITQIADRMLNKISKEFMGNKYSTTNSGSNQFLPSNSNSSGSHMQYGSGSNSSQPQAGHNPYGYASTNQSGNYTGSAPQYHPQGQPNTQQGEISQHAQAPHGQFGYTGPSAYPQYNTNQQGLPSNSFSLVNQIPQQPWQSQTSMTHDAPPPYEQSTAAHGQPMPPAPEWQAGARPTVPHSTKPGSNNPMPMPNQPQQQNDFQHPYHHQGQLPQQHPGQPLQNAYPHGQMGHDVPPQPQPFYGAPGMPGPMHQNLPPSNNFEQSAQHPSYSGPQHQPPYSPVGGGMPGSAPGFQNSGPMAPGHMPGSHQDGSLHQGSLVPPPNHYPGTNMPAGSNTQSHAFAVELPDNQVNPNRPPINMQNHPSAGQHHGQPFLQSQNTSQPLPGEMSGAEPMRQTPTDPQFVSGPWATPPAASNHHYPPPNRYNNSGGY